MQPTARRNQQNTIVLGRGKAFMGVVKEIEPYFAGGYEANLIISGQLETYGSGIAHAALQATSQFACPSFSSGDAQRRFRIFFFLE